MYNKTIQILKNFDWILFSPIVLLVIFGLAEIYSVALGQGGASMGNFNRQLAVAVLGCIAVLGLAFLDYHSLRNFSNYLFIGGIIALILVLLFGETIRGTKGWFDIFGFRFQPVELAKLLLILYLARYFSSFSLKKSRMRHLIIASAGFLIYFLLILAQPDFGSAMMLFFIWFIMVLMAGFDRMYFAVIALAILGLFVCAWLFYLKPYQKQRIITFVNPSFEPLDQGYNVAQAIIAVGAGRMFGRGIGFGSQSQLKFLPESQNDFIFAVIAEELGFMGAVLVIVFFSIFIFRSIYNIKYVVKDDFGTFFIIGATGLFVSQMFINIGMNIGILPVVGVSLPFVSYGGSSLLSGLFTLGIMENIIVKSRIKGHMHTV